MKRILSVAMGAVIAIAAGLFAWPEPASAQRVLPNADNCVRISTAPSGSAGTDNWSPFYRATNGCPESVIVYWKHNYGLKGEGYIKCSGGGTGSISPGSSRKFGAGVLPRGIQSNIRWCADYFRGDHQDATGSLVSQQL